MLMSSGKHLVEYKDVAHDTGEIHHAGDVIRVFAVLGKVIVAGMP